MESGDDMDGRYLTIYEIDETEGSDAAWKGAWRLSSLSTQWPGQHS
jgi:hypothetical protein